MTINPKEFQEKREFNPFLWTVRKNLFALRRYAINKLLLLIGIGLLLLIKFSDTIPLHIGIVVACVFIAFGFSLRIAFEWERVPVLRLGRLHKTYGPGLFFLIPIIDTPYGYVDCRTTATAFP